MLNIILAISDNGVIGNDGGLPWPTIKEDMKWFREKTTGCSVVMGRKTWESLGDNAPLKGRVNIVISQTIAPGADFTISIDPVAKQQCPSILHESISGIVAATTEDGIPSEAFVIGGKTLYEELAPYADTFYITRVRAEYKGDVSLNLNELLSGTQLVENTNLPAETSRPELDFQIYKRK